MWKKLNDIRKRHPIPFWVVCLVVFPLAIFVGVWLLLRRGGPQDRDVLDAAAKEQGRADVHHETAQTEQRKGQEQDKDIAQKRQEVLDALARVKTRAEKYKATNRNIQDAQGWGDLDKQAGVK